MNAVNYARGGNSRIFFSGFKECAEANLELSDSSFWAACKRLGKDVPS
jgi:hypothetical protein